MKLKTNLKNLKIVSNVNFTLFFNSFARYITYNVMKIFIFMCKKNRFNEENESLFFLLSLNALFQQFFFRCFYSIKL